ncbi:hypothetical protein [Glycomyces tenuis]|uniref:hypothetical protein n=1 Tax=Glycomyces tenuis TaxID=58116 RepID=UPI000479CA4B|nr:hypothetical protein [Glycomyces tenuis]
MTPVSIIPCTSEVLRWLDRCPAGAVEPDAEGWPRFTYPTDRCELRKGWQVALLRTDGELQAVVIARRGKRAGRVESTFEVRAWRPFDARVSVEEVRQVGRTVKNALDRSTDLTEVQERDLIAELGRRIPWLPGVIEAWRQQTEPAPIPNEVLGQLSLERDVMRTTFGIAGQPIARIEAHGYERGHRSFLRGMTTGQRVGEDAMIRHDWINLTGWNPPVETDFDALTFTNPDGDGELTVIYANKERLEHGTGADLIYIDEIRNALVLIQYKRMKDKAPGGGPGYRPDKQLEKELVRLRAVRDHFDERPPAANSWSFRLLPEPCYVKLCDPVDSLDLGTKPVPGMMLPLSLFEQVHSEIEGTGPKGGTCFSRKNVSRHLSSTFTIDLIKEGWLGTRTSQDAFHILKDFCDSELEARRSLTLAKKSGKRHKKRK